MTASPFSAELDQFLAKHRQSGERIVFTNGCFDILHRGHITYLNEARALGDLLVVGINSDRSVSKLKGPSRPVNRELDRKFVLENLCAISFVEIFDDPTPLKLIEHIRPSVLVKGGDWPIKDIVGAKEVMSWGGEVKTLSFVTGYSTSSTIQKILSL